MQYQIYIRRPNGVEEIVGFVNVVSDRIIVSRRTGPVGNYPLTTPIESFCLTNELIRQMFD